MQEIVAHCDLHLERDNTRVPGTGYKIGIAGAWKRIDLCPDCVTQLLGPIEQALLAHAREITEEAPAQRKQREYTPEELQRKNAGRKIARQCLWCPRILPSLDEFTAHVQQLHGFDGLAQAYGDTCPICRQRATWLPAHVGRGHRLNLAAAFEWAYYGGDDSARPLAEARRAAGANVEDPARTDQDTLDAAHAAQERWFATHG